MPMQLDRGRDMGGAAEAIQCLSRKTSELYPGIVSNSPLAQLSFHTMCMDDKLENVTLILSSSESNLRFSNSKSRGEVGIGVQEKGQCPNRTCHRHGDIPQLRMAIHRVIITST